MLRCVQLGLLHYQVFGPESTWHFHPTLYKAFRENLIYFRGNIDRNLDNGVVSVHRQFLCLRGNVVAVYARTQLPSVTDPPESDWGSSDLCGSSGSVSYYPVTSINVTLLVKGKGLPVIASFIQDFLSFHHFFRTFCHSIISPGLFVIPSLLPTHLNRRPDPGCKLKGGIN